MKTAIRTPIVEAIRAAIKGFGGLSAIFHWPGTHTLAATTGTTPTFTRATSATFEDFEGVIRTAESSEPRFVGARRVENLFTVSNDFGNALFVAETGITKNGVVSGVGPNGEDAYSVTMATSVPANGLRYSLASVIDEGATVSTSILIRAATGSGEVRLWVAGNGPDASPDISVDTTWKRIDWTHTTSIGGGMNWRLTPNSAGDTITVYIMNVQAENVTGQTNQNPSEYVSTGVGTGAELVTNGDFSNGTTGWNAYSANISVVGGEAEVVSTGLYAQIWKSIPTVAGLTYQLSATARCGTAPTVNLRAETALTAGNLVNLPTSSTTNVTLSGSFTATGSSTIIGLAQSATLGTAYLDNITLRQASHGANIDGVQYFNTLNANTVTGNVVTEAVGSPLTRANTQFGELMAAGDYFSTPNVVTTWGELDVRVRVTHSRSTTYNIIASKHVNAIGQSWILWNDPNGVPFAAYYNAIGGAVNIPSAGSAPFAVGQIGWIRLTIDTATGDCKYWTADGNLESPAISDYTQLGTTKNPAGGATAINITTAPFWVGSYASAANPSYNGKFYRAQVFNEIDGTTPVVDFTPGSYVSGSTLVSSTSGETWTLNGNASVFQPPVDASGPFGYLAEKASTNLALQSEDFTTSWVAQGSTISANAAVAPDGTTTMDRVVVGTTTAIHNVYQNISTTVDTNYTYSVYMKDDGAGFGGISLGHGTNFVAVVVDLSTGLVTDTEVGAGSGTIVATGCEDVGNGIYRVWISGRIGNAAGWMFLFASDAAVPATWLSGRPSYTGVLGEDILVWGAQVE